LLCKKSAPDLRRKPQPPISRVGRIRGIADVPLAGRRRKPPRWPEGAQRRKQENSRAGVRAVSDVEVNETPPRWSSLWWAATAVDHCPGISDSARATDSG
tara:strand:+ start:133 stop:432 length:300 start_codon:yes stop_codon:yes gene_type:complete